MVKRIYSILLAFTFLLSLFSMMPFSADAKAMEEVERIEAEKADTAETVEAEELIADTAESAQAENLIVEAVEEAAIPSEAVFSQKAETAELFAAEPKSLRLEPPTNTTIIQGSVPDVSGLKVYAVYPDETETEVTDYTLTGINSSQLGQQMVIVSWQGLMNYFSVTVEKAPEEDYIAGFFLFSKPKREYFQGEPLDLTGMKLYVYHHLSPVTQVGPDECVVTGYNPNQIGIQTLTVSYGGKSSEFLVIVKPNGDDPVPENMPNLMAPRISIESVPGGKDVSFSRQNNNDSEVISQLIKDGNTSVTSSSRVEVYYTQDDSVPVPGSDGTLKYTGSKIHLEETKTIKAMAVLLDQDGTVVEKSSVVSGRVSVSQVETPRPANPHHKNNQGPNGGMTELEPGTLVSLLCDTSGASIYYWIEGHVGSAEDSRYGSSIYIDSDYADKNGEMVICAYAAKDGYQNSQRMRLRYRVPKQEPPAAEIVNVSMGSVRSRAGENLSASLSITTEASSHVTGFTITVSYDRRTVEFLSISPVKTGGSDSDDVIPAGQLFAAPDAANGIVRIMCGDVEADGGEMCTLNFRAFDSSEDQELPLTVDAEKVSTDSGRPVEKETYPGSIQLEGSVNSQLTASVLFNRNESETDGETSQSAQATASITVDEESAKEYVDSVLKESADNPALTVTATAFVAFYGEDGNMLSLESWEIDLSDLMYLIFERTMAMPDNASEMKTMVFSESLVAIMAADELEEL